jgi:hypothetical protein
MNSDFRGLKGSTKTSFDETIKFLSHLIGEKDKIYSGHNVIALRSLKPIYIQDENDKENH